MTIDDTSSAADSNQLLAAFANQYSEIILPSNYLLTYVRKFLSWFV